MAKKKGKSQNAPAPADQPSTSGATSQPPQQQQPPVASQGGGRGGHQQGDGGRGGGQGGGTGGGRGGGQGGGTGGGQGGGTGGGRGGHQGGGGGQEGGRGGHQQGGSGGRGGYQVQQEGGRGGHQRGGGGGDGYQGQQGGGRGGQQYSGGRGSPSPSQGSGGGGEDSVGRGSPVSSEHSFGQGGRGGGRGGRGVGRGDRGGRGQQQAPPSFGTQQYPGLGQPPTAQHEQRQQPPPISSQPFPGLVSPPSVQQVPQRPPIEQVTEKVAKLQLQQKQRPQPTVSRPATASAVPAADMTEVPANFRKGGTQGRKIKVLANHFQIKMSQKLTTAYQYDVALDPDKPKKLLPYVMQQMQQTYYPKNFPAFDGMKNLFSAHKLPLDMPFTGIAKIMEDDREKEYQVKIQFAREVDLAALIKFFNQSGQNHMLPPMHVLQCFDVVLRSRPSTSMITAGRSYFSVPEQIVPLGNGMEMYRGFYQSAILGWKPFLNVDVSHKAFPTQMSVLDLIREIDDRADLNRELMRNTEEKLAKFLFNLKVEYVIPSQPATKRSYRVNGLDQNANLFKFTNDQGRELTVATYFQELKRYRLKYPHLPCLWVGSKQRRPKMVLPCELCSVIAGQVTNRKMDEIQTRNMIKQAATNTAVRKGNIMHSMKVANHNSSPSMQEFGLSVDPNMTEVVARVLQPPTIKYQNAQRPQIVSKGVWRGGTFIEAINIVKWAIVCFDDKIYENQLTDMRDLLAKQGRQYGMNISSDIRPIKIRLNQYGQKDIYRYFEQCKADGLQLVVVVLLDYNKSCYAWVKQTAELQTGCLTQCIKSGTMRRMNTQTVDNILLKINAKLNGINHVLGEKPPVLKRPVMIMGADVTHPSPESRDSQPSVAAVTASHDPQAFGYNLEWRVQDPTAEIITDLQEITIKHLRFFRMKTNFRPERIIFYRDGVSDGQFKAVRDQEIQAIRNACSSLDVDYKPPITFLVVQKRHHTRLFPCDARDSEDRNGNVPAGTCVDTLITHPTAQDFYLVSHASIQGVAKPTKYRTIWDDSDFTDDDIEQLTYYLCHLFARCNRSVSYPAPTYYAHLAAARAKVYIEDQRIDMRTLKTMHERIPIKEIIQKEHPMFFV